MAGTTADKAAQPFDYAATLRALHTGTFRTSKSPELSAIQQHEERHGNPPGDPRHSVRLSLSKIFGRAITESGSGGYLVGTALGQYLPALQQRSLVFQLGARVIPATKTNVALPRGTTSATTSYETGETTIIAETENLYGQIATTPKTLTIFSKVSRQLLIQSNVGQIVSQEQAAAAGTAVDAAVIGGSGNNGQPTGILSTAGTGAFTGATLGYAALIAGQQAVSDANAVLNPFTLGYLTTPTVAGLLKQRYRTASANVEIPLWGGPLAGGNIEGVRAFSTRNVPAASMVYGDFSTVQVFMWDDVSIEVDPFSAFQTAQVGIRLILPYDVVLTYPAAFAISTGIT